MVICFYYTWLQLRYNTLFHTHIANVLIHALTLSVYWNFFHSMMLISEPFICPFLVDIGTTNLFPYLFKLWHHLILYRRSSCQWLFKSHTNCIKIFFFHTLGFLLLARVIAATCCVTLSASMAARLGSTPMAAFQICLQTWLACSLLADGLAFAGQVREPFCFSLLLTFFTEIFIKFKLS